MMSKFICVACILIGSLISCRSTTSLTYTFKKPVNDSLQAAVHKISLLYDKDTNNCFYAVVYENDLGGSNVIIDASQKSSPIVQLSNKSNRFIIVGKIKIPMLFLSDSFSNESKLLGIEVLPTTGYLVSFDRDGRVDKTGMLY